jgi:hypothetical protein
MYKLFITNLAIHCWNWQTGNAENDIKVVIGIQGSAGSQATALTMVLCCLLLQAFEGTSSPPCKDCFHESLRLLCHPAPSFVAEHLVTRLKMDEMRIWIKQEYQKRLSFSRRKFLVLANQILFPKRFIWTKTQKRDLKLNWQTLFSGCLKMILGRVFPSIFNLLWTFGQSEIASGNGFPRRHPVSARIAR